MKKLFLIFFAVTAISRAQKPTASPSASNENPAMQEIRLNEKKWLDAFYRLDLTTLETLEATDFRLITPLAIVTKEQQRAMILARLSSEGPSNAPQIYTLEDQTIRIYSNWAVVSDVCMVTGGGKNPATSPGRYWQTEVWQNDAGMWKLIHLHISPVLHGK